MKLHVDKLVLDMRGDISAPTAEQAAALLGPALAEALRRAGPAAAAGAGRTESLALQVAAQPEAAALARQIAGHLAPQLLSHLGARPAAAPPISTRSD